MDWGLGFETCGLEFGIQCLNLRNLWDGGSLRLRVSGFGFRMLSCGFQVQGFEY